MRSGGPVIIALIIYSLTVGLSYILISFDFFKDDPVAKEALLRHYREFSLSAGILAFVAGAISLAYDGGNALYSPELIALLTAVLFILGTVPDYWFIARRSHSGIAQMPGPQRYAWALAISGMIAYVTQVVVTEIQTRDMMEALLGGYGFCSVNSIFPDANMGKFYQGVLWRFIRRAAFIYPGQLTAKAAVDKRRLSCYRFANKQNFDI